MTSKLHRTSGTMISVVPFNKGIVIAADSRLKVDMANKGVQFTDKISKIRTTRNPQRAFAIAGSPSISDASQVPFSPPYEEYLLSGPKIFDAHPIVSGFLSTVNALLTESDLKQLSDNILSQRKQVVQNFSVLDEMDIIIIEHSKRKLLRSSQIARIRYYFEGSNDLRPDLSIEKFYFYSKSKLNLYGDKGEYTFFVDTLNEQRSNSFRKNKESLNKKTVYRVDESEAVAIATEVVQMTVDYINKPTVNANYSIGGTVTKHLIR